MRKITHLVVAGAVMAAGAITSMQPAGAAGTTNRGVKDVDYHDAIDSCLSGQALPCTPNAGSGESNVLRVKQLSDGGGLAFDDIETTSAWGDDYVWLGATIGAECKLTYDLTHASVGLGWQNANWHAPSEVEPVGATVYISVPDAQSMPEKLVALNYSLDATFGGGHVWDFSSPEDVYAYGESVIDDRIAAGQNEATARSQGFTFDTWIATHADVSCDRSGRSDPWTKRVGWFQPVTFEFVGVPVPPVGGTHRPATGLIADPAVVDASLSVVPDPSDDCIVHLSGTITTNSPMEVEYRFVNPYGQPSNTYTVDVDHTLVAMVDRSAEVPTADGPDPDGGFVNPAGGGGHGPADDLSTGADDDQWSGTFELEVLSPNAMVAVDGFAVDYC